MLSGGNDNDATDLKACVGECDADTQCAAGLKCFQRSKGESVPGCTGAGAKGTWDYCYDPAFPAPAKTLPDCIGRCRYGFWKKEGNIFRVGIFLDSVRLTTRAEGPHGAHVRRAKRNRVDHSWIILPYVCRNMTATKCGYVAWQPITSTCKM